MLKLFSLLISFCIFSNINALPSPGKCIANAPVINDFNLDQFGGRWYEIERIDDGGYSRNLICLYYSFIRTTGAFDYNLSLNSVNSATSVISNLMGTAYRRLNAPSTLITNFIYPVKRSNVIQVLSTDYSKYAVIYSCNQVSSSTKDEYAWIVSRQKLLDDNLVSKLKIQLKNFGVDINKFEKTNQIDARCTR